MRSFDSRGLAFIRGGSYGDLVESAREGCAMRPSRWKDVLAAEMPEALAREIDIFETQIHLRKEGKIEEKLFAETRLRRGAYGQRYDNGQRHDGEAMRDLSYPSGALT